MICGVSRKGKGLLGFFWNCFGQGMNRQGWYKSVVLTRAAQLHEFLALGVGGGL